MVIWLTGLSGSGKTTIGKELKKKLKNAILIDGDLLRKKHPCGFTIKERRKNIQRAIKLAKKYQKEGKIAIVALTSPFLDQRIKARRLFKDFIEVYLKCPIEICEKRKPEIYKKKKYIVGRDIKYEAPLFPEIVIETDKISLKEAVKKIFLFLKKWRRLKK